MLPPSGSGGSAGSAAGTGGGSQPTGNGGQSGAAPGGAGGTAGSGTPGAAGTAGMGTGGRGGAGGTGNGGVGGIAGAGTAGVGGIAGAGTAGVGGRGGMAGGAAGATPGGAGGTSFAGAGGAGLAGSGGAGLAGTGGISAAGAGGAPGCSPSCDSNHTCVSTKCLLIDGLQCTLASQCASGVCSPFYVDQDGDGYGTGTAVGFCGTTTPIGYAAQSGDCCDTASNLAVAKLIHPGADFQTTSAGGVCGGITWDYDCDGMIETNPKTIMCNPNPPDCTYQVVDYGEDGCGGGPSNCSCAPAGPNYCAIGCSGHPGTIACR